MISKLKRRAISYWNRLQVWWPFPSLASLRTAYRLAQLISIARILRSPLGCPWDREQRLADLLPCLREETAEALAAAHHWQQGGPASEMAAELGDVLFVLVFMGIISEEQGLFDFDQPLRNVIAKMLRRHPHVFSDAIEDTSSISRLWSDIKRREQQAQDHTHHSSLLKVKPELSTLAEAQKLGKVAATVGFDWPDIQGVWHKVCEELDELQAELPNNRANASNQRMSDELGDLLFALVNLARHLKVNAEEALHAANLRFRKRFAYIEQQLQLQNRSLADTPLEQLEALWQEAKTQP